MRWTLWTSFAVLCILAATSWVIPDVANGLPQLEQQGILFGLVGLIAVAFSGRRLWSGIAGVRWIWLAAASVMFFGVPMVVGEYARGSVSAITRSALFAMVPVVVVMVVAAGDASGGEERGARRFLVPALVGLGGLLLLLPLGSSGSIRGRVLLAIVCAAVVLVGFASVWMYRLLREFSFVEAIGIAGIANAVFLLGWSVVRGEIVWTVSGLVSVVSLSSLVDLLEVLLIVWLLREMAPIRFAARYLAIPLVTILESFVLMRPEWTVRMVSGTVLLAVGVGMLLFWKADAEETTLSLR
jgi:drug/metabolite transporter (DMT)-like permease